MKKNITFALIAVLSMTFASCEKSDQETLLQPANRIQQIVAEEMTVPVANREPDWACAILLDKDGRVVALFDTDPSNAHINQAMRLGSIMQPFTILWALQTQGVDASSSFEIFKNGISTGPYYVKDLRPIDSILFIPDIIAIGSSVGTFEIFRHASWTDVGSQENFNSFMSQLGIETHMEYFWEIELQSYSNELAISPLHLAYLYHKLAQGLFPQEWAEETAIIRKGLHEVVWNNKLGTASRSVWSNGAQSDKIHIMGKTGSLPINGDPRHHIISFCGSFPEENPEYTCLIMMYDPQYPYSANMDCAVPVRKIAERIYK